MKTIIVKVNNAEKTVAEHRVVTQTEPTILQSQSNVNYELFDISIGRAPNHIVTKRINNDLHVSLEQDGDNDNLIIQGFYIDEDNALIGVAENNNYYYYIPDTGEVVSYVTELANITAEGHALGGYPQPHARWVDEALTSDHSDAIEFAGVPWLVGLLGVASVAALIDRRNCDDEHDILRDSSPEPEIMPELGSGSSSTTELTSYSSTTVIADDTNIFTGDTNTGDTNIVIDYPQNSTEATFSTLNHIPELSYTALNLSSTINLTSTLNDDGNKETERAPSTVNLLIVEQLDANDCISSSELIAGSFLEFNAPHAQSGEQDLSVIPLPVQDLPFQYLLGVIDPVINNTFDVLNTFEAPYIV